MNPESSRRSACDRCRGQKLRCVRSTNPDSNGSASHDETISLEPCERCLKAGAECINSLPRHRKFIRAPRERNRPPFSSPPSADKAPAYHQHYLPRLSATPRRSLTGQLEPSVILGGEHPSKKRIGEQNALLHHGGRVTQNALDASSSFPFDAGNDQSSGDSSNTPFIDLLGSATGAIAGGNEFDLDARLNSAAPGDPGKDPLSRPSSHHTTSEEAVPPLPALTADSIAETSIPPREDSLHRLSQLSSSLVKNLARTSAVNLADTLSYMSHLDSSTVRPTGAQAASPKNTIGVVMDHSQTFLDILRRLKQQIMPYPPMSSAESQCSYSEYWDDHPFLMAADGDGQVIPDATTQARPLAMDTHQAQGASSLFSSSDSSAATPPVPVDMPTTLTILTCYTWLLQLYDAIFAQIYEALAQEGLSTKCMPAILPGLHIGGFPLDDHRDLQMEVLLKLSMEMLERIEEVLGIGVISQRTNLSSQSMAAFLPARGILDAAPASAVLDIMFKPKENTYAGGPNREGQSWNPAMLKQTMQDIRELLRAGDC
ncbi:hypothetical protein BDV26DRAFT_297072 [Aspergillus bertholletiae]|uniref:Zn(2)-C6 fungal-type domain-containing protein n=1 Tax=Aspergillus bertholletiae TaxID=1226010 RepID=A0A5N7AU80_9EURO|nr:hypothetical protein BDV26DRAFT_297072 [Aspergillus bertholletiae]